MNKKSTDISGVRIQTVFLNLALVICFALPGFAMACADFGVAIGTGDKFEGIKVRSTANGVTIRLGETLYNVYHVYPKVSPKKKEWCFKAKDKPEKCFEPEGKGQLEVIGEKEKNGDFVGIQFNKSEGNIMTMGLVKRKSDARRDELSEEQLVFDYDFSAKPEPKHLTNDVIEFEKENGVSEKARMIHHMKVTLQNRKLSTGIDTFFTTKIGSLDFSKVEIPNGERDREVFPKSGKANLASGGDYEGVPDGNGCQTTVREVEKTAHAAPRQEPSSAVASRSQNNSSTSARGLARSSASSERGATSSRGRGAAVTH